MELKTKSKLIDFSNPYIRSCLPILLYDHTTGHNIIWATDPPEELNAGFFDEITIEQLDKVQLVPRVQKRLEERKKRTTKKAEVFTPTWICKKMVDFLETERKPDNWKAYISHTTLEVTCGEAPFVVSRYDTVTGQAVELKDRIGLLDRKLKIAYEHDPDNWLLYVFQAYSTTYGFEWQGDSLLLARANMLLTFCEYYKEYLKEEPSESLCGMIATYISWNFWQMDGLKGTVPETDTRCVIYNWKENRQELFPHEDIGVKDGKKKTRRRRNQVPHQDQESIFSKRED